MPVDQYGTFQGGYYSPPAPVSSSPSAETAKFRKTGLIVMFALLVCGVLYVVTVMPADNNESYPTDSPTPRYRAVAPVAPSSASSGSLWDSIFGSSQPTHQRFYQHRDRSEQYPEFVEAENPFLGGGKKHYVDDLNYEWTPRSKGLFGTGELGKGMGPLPSDIDAAAFEAGFAGPNVAAAAASGSASGAASGSAAASGDAAAAASGAAAAAPAAAAASGSAASASS